MSFLLETGGDSSCFVFLFVSIVFGEDDESQKIHRYTGCDKEMGVPPMIDLTDSDGGGSKNSDKRQPGGSYLHLFTCRNH